MPSTPSATPFPLRIAAALVALQGAVLTVLAVLEISHVAAERMAMGVTTSIFFAGYGLGLLACAWALLRQHSWARGPVLLTQLIQLGLAWNLRDFPLVALPLAVVGIAVIVAMLHPATRAVLEDDPTGSRGEED
ncbi:hypothetical protein [Nocardioides sp. cx-173]|uniref:hypothetical protein n=1 Tax=Nocardioides sp. cx-173 TaxID=2898796 RepID=UPI001E484C32|nr:hypothetical protein [Nocardioides sp. cx-173]MCD4526164.1 hypothetical protein [Nocardioides sp. cx-173]UGB40621.1 hypothetical protein LQ940_14705 [Nocardioides sp. cx-173]